MAIDGLQLIELRLRFHAFGYYIQIHAATHADHRVDYGDIFFALEFLNKRLVDFERVNREAR